jgi:hypothetical protein
MFISMPHSISRIIGFAHAILVPPKNKAYQCSLVLAWSNVYATKVQVSPLKD